MLASVVFLALAASVTSAHADEPAPPPKLPQRVFPGFAILGNLGFAQTQRVTVNYGGWISPQTNPSDAEQQRLTVQIPVYADDQNNVQFSTGGSSLHFGEPEILDKSGTLVPRDLWKIEFGSSYSRKLEDEKYVGGRLSLGSASDHPFSAMNVTTIGASGYYTWATSERSRWAVTLFYSNNNPISNYFPIPGFIYAYQTKSFTGLFGLPFMSLIWRPAVPWMLTLSIFGPTLNSEIAYGSPRVFQVFTGFSWAQQSYLLENRPDTRDRLTFEEMRTPLGVRFPFFGIKSELSAGYAFNRSLYEGTHFRNKDEGSASLGGSWFGAWNLRAEL